MKSITKYYLYNGAKIVLEAATPETLVDKLPLSTESRLNALRALKLSGRADIQHPDKTKNFSIRRVVYSDQNKNSLL